MNKYTIHNYAGVGQPGKYKIYKHRGEGYSNPIVLAGTYSTRKQAKGIIKNLTK